MPSNQGYTKVAGVAEEDERLDSTMVKNKPELNPSGGSGLPSTHSSQQLMPTDTESVSTSLEDTSRDIPIPYSGFGSISAKDWFTVIVLCFVNLINYMDRFTIAGKPTILLIIFF